MKRSHCKNCKFMNAISKDGLGTYVYCDISKKYSSALNRYITIAEFLERPCVDGVKCPTYCFHYELKKKEKKKKNV